MGRVGPEGEGAESEIEMAQLDRLGIEAIGRMNPHQEPVGYVIDPSDPTILRTAGEEPPEPPLEEVELPGDR